MEHTTDPSVTRQITSSPASQHEISIHSSILLEQDSHDTSISSVSTTGTEKHPKGKRKRTGAQDKVFLEEAYNKNPKPDKQARLEIVERVSLNEKEVQIWFQNRRQNDRRKSRPLSPQEIAALRYGGLQSLSSSDPVAASVLEHVGAMTSSEPSASQPHPPAGSSSPQLSQTSPRTVEEKTSVTSDRMQPGTPVNTTPAQDSILGSQESQGSAHSTQPIGYLANRWNVGASLSNPATPALDADGHPNRYQLPPSSCASDTTHVKPRSQSNVRLSLSLEGKAELVSNGASPVKQEAPRQVSSQPLLPLGLPQPHRQGQGRKGLQRSYSALPAITLPPISALTRHLPPRLGRGRSRNVRAWESCAQSQPVDELTTQAENESNGSALAAITLLRSTSGSAGTKRDASAHLKGTTASHASKKTKLGRTCSSVARLETGEEKLPSEKLDAKDGKAGAVMVVSPTGSDKENWSPDEHGDPRRTSPRRRRPLPANKTQNARRLGRVLQENSRPSLLNARAHTMPMGKDKGDIEVFEDGEDENGNTKKSIKRRKAKNEDVEKFMRGEVSPSKKGDMDCVAGLLSLSQGAWR